jgi:hypothetical protein
MEATVTSDKVEPLFHLVKSEVVPMTAELAQQFRTMQGSPTEREVNESRLKHLREKFLLGLLIPFNWCVANLNGVKYRMNGQHSSTVLCELDGAFPKGAIAIMSEFAVDNKEGLAQLFRQFDDRKSGRTPADVAGAYQGLFDEIKGVPRASAKLAIEGAAWWRRYKEGLPTPTGDDVYKLFGIAALHSFIEWIGELFTIKTPEMRKAPIVAAMYACFEKNEAEAKKFWDQVARGGDQFEDQAPTTVLDAWLKEIKTGEYDLKPAQIYQGCVFAWNAYRSDKQISKIKFDAKQMPEASD